MHFGHTLSYCYRTKTKQIIGRIPCYGMAEDTPSGSFDSTSFPASGSRGVAQDDRDKVSRLTCGNQTDPLPFVAGQALHPPLLINC